MLKNLFLCLALSLPAAAVPDGKVTGLNSSVFQALRLTHPTVWLESHARTLAATAWEDGKLDEAESDLFQELSHEGPTPQGVVVSGTGAEPPITRQTATRSVALLFRVAQLAPALRAAGWHERLPELIAYAGASPEQEQQVVALLTFDLRYHYMQSNFANSYGPIKYRLQKLDERMKALGDQADTGERLLYKAAEQLDRLEDDRVQDCLYKYLEPKS